MYERVTIKCGDSQHSMVLSQADKSLLSLIGERVSTTAPAPTQSTPSPAPAAEGRTNGMQMDMPMDMKK